MAKIQLSVMLTQNFEGLQLLDQIQMFCCTGCHFYSVSGIIYEIHHHVLVDVSPFLLLEDCSKLEAWRFLKRIFHELWDAAWTCLNVLYLTLCSIDVRKWHSRWQSPIVLMVRCSKERREGKEELKLVRPVAVGCICPLESGGFLKLNIPPWIITTREGQTQKYVAHAWRTVRWKWKGGLLVVGWWRCPSTLPSLENGGSYKCWNIGCSILKIVKEFSVVSHLIQAHVSKRSFLKLGLCPKERIDTQDWFFFPRLLMKAHSPTAFTMFHHRQFLSST